MVKTTLAPTFGAALFTALLRLRSATWGVRVALLWSSSLALLLLGVESGSYWSAAVTCAVLVTPPTAALVTVAVTVRVASAPLASAAMFQTLSAVPGL